jgi:hypothetical protein
MTRSLSVAAAFFAASLALAGDSEPATQSVTWTGWFSDFDCASGRVASGIIAATNPDCAKQCIAKGAAPVFISEQAKALFQVKAYPKLVDDLGYHVEVQAKVDTEAKTIEILQVKRLEYQGASCGRPPKPAK